MRSLAPSKLTNQGTGAFLCAALLAETVERLEQLPELFRGQSWTGVADADVAADRGGVGVLVQVGLVDRGELRVGAHGDIVIFDADEIASEQAKLVTDLPGDSSRLSAGSMGVKRVLVNGVTIVENGVANGAVPGTVLKSGIDTYTVTAR